ncbi:MAG: TIGR04222 domain-containing membrane protein [Acidobacteriota bacterium]|nr:TIGR04222 domain-containing membrane protein [Acidobacteriota bacterium]
MNWLFDNPLANLPGPYFLVFYGFVILSAIIAFRIVKSRLDLTGKMPLPPIPAEPDPFEIAYLRGGANELARAATFALNQKNLVEITQNGKAIWIQQTAQANQPRLSPIERAVFNYYSEPRKPKELFQKGGLKETLQPFAMTYEARLAAQNFLTDSATKTLIRKLSLIFAAAIVGLGGYKLVTAVLNGYSNYGFLIVMEIVGSIILLVMSNAPRLTEHGKKYLERLQLAFEKLKFAGIDSKVNLPQKPAASFSAVDPLLLGVGVFGTTALVGSVYDNYNQAFHKAQQAQTSSGGSSGCGTSSDSSSCSSGSDGGGGCGGGCGGCG